MLSRDLLAIIWYIILTVAWLVYLSLESFVVGSGMLQKVVSKESKTQKSIQISSGLHWDGIEVWLITALGGTFAAFPLTYAKITESLYIAFFLLLLALIVRGVAIELMYKDENPKWQKWMKTGWQISSFLIPLVFGVYFSNIFSGLKIGKTGYEGSFFGLFDLKAIVCGVLFVAIALTTGADWIILTTRKGEHHTKAQKIAVKSSIVVALAATFMMMAFNTGTTTFTKSQLFNSFPVLWALPVLTIAFALLTLVFSLIKKTGLAFLSGCLTQVMFIATGFTAIFPYMVPSSIDSKFGISLFQAAGSQYTLKLMFFVALVFVPIVLIYQTWKFLRFSSDKNES